MSRLMRLWHLSPSVNAKFSNTHAQQSNRATRLIFGQTLCLLPYFICANSEGSGETTRMRSLTWAFAPAHPLFAYAISTIISWAGSFKSLFSQKRLGFTDNLSHYSLAKIDWVIFICHRLRCDLSLCGILVILDNINQAHVMTILGADLGIMDSSFTAWICLLTHRNHILKFGITSLWEYNTV